MKDSDFLYATIGNTSLQYSSDDGNTWLQRETNMQGGFISAFIKKGSNFYASTYNAGSVYRSVDSLKTWEIFENGLIGNSIIFKFVFIGDDLFAGANETLMRTSDSVADWIAVSRHPLLSIPTSSGNILFSTGGDNGNYNNEILSSVDHGYSWKNVTDNFSGGTCHFIFTNDLYLFAVLIMST